MKIEKLERHKGARTLSTGMQVDYIIYEKLKNYGEPLYELEAFYGPEGLNVTVKLVQKGAADKTVYSGPYWDLPMDHAEIPPGVYTTLRGLVKKLF